MKQLEIIGEAATGPLPDVSLRFDLAWPESIGMRQRLVHAYFDVDPEVVWQTVVEDVPLLHQRVGAFLRAL